MVSVSVVFGAHNAEAVLPDTVAALRTRLAFLPSAEVIIVENGSTDQTALIADRLSTTENPSVITATSPVGLGNAFRVGVALTTGDLVVCTAADLPFGFTDLDGYQNLSDPPPVVIGSKAHPASTIERGLLRGILTRVLRIARFLVLRSRVGDSQGTLLMDGATARRLFARSEERGYLVTAEVIAHAEKDGLGVLEVPIALNDRKSPSTVRPLRDGIDMLVGLFRIRRSLKSRG